MSRIGRLPIPVPGGVDVDINGARSRSRARRARLTHTRRRAHHRRAGRGRRARRHAARRRARVKVAARAVPHAGRQHGHRRDRRVREDARDRRHRLPRAGQGLATSSSRSASRTRSAPGARGHHLRGRGADAVRRCAASTSSRSARSPPTSASCASPSPTRARAFATRVKSCVARSERLVSSHALHRLMQSRARRAESRARPPCVGKRRRHFRRAQEGRRHRRRPRLVVTRSSRHVFAQVVDDTQRPHACFGLDLEADVRATAGDKTAKAKQVGELSRRGAPRPPVSGRSSSTAAAYQYHGRVAALADGAREGGLDVLMNDSLTQDPSMTLATRNV